MIMLMACLLFSYTTARIIKDTLLVSGSGAQAISFVKTFVVAPASIVSAIGIASVNKSMTRKNALIAIWMFYSIVFFIYAHLVYPYIDTLHMSEESILAWQAAYPSLKCFIAIIGNWSTTLFYTIADISGINILTFAFWQVAGQVTSTLSTNDTKRIYGTYSMYGNIFGIITAGNAGTILAGFIQDKEILIRTRITLVSVALFAAALIYMYIYNYLLVDKERDAAPVRGKSKPKLSLMDSLKMVMGSKYLLCLAVIILGYGISINLVEVTWKDSVKELYPNKADYMQFFDEFYVTMGTATFVTGIVGRFITNRLGWLGTALATPIVLAITSFLFYAFALLSNPGFVGKGISDYVGMCCMAIGCTPLWIAVYAGYVQNILSKSTKYVLFDPSTQITYAPLEHDLKTTGKAAVDVVAGKSGKIVGSLIQSVLAMITGYSQQEMAPMLLLALVGVMIAWIVATISLRPLYYAELEAHAARSANNRDKA